ncbi:Non-ribosomal peptide synthetase/alpha-aminoadipate reductase and related enzymes [Phaffia rhodozyma]|uniref:Non-ribosomal peptide synthetase/alpha-aminoadipate reductase and related enzymes n=1 Tax=Phaffia rhodozyma TaxID=264483 RepID=A0A0F7SGD0_PHARH|nr:Non-ribosomal peptide synthetase/alpha-aminoadipate reductase and related enzymes [Phaffia rhodozyma]
MPPLSYLVMTASDAAEYNAQDPNYIRHSSLNQLLEERASSCPNSIAAAFAAHSAGKNEWGWDTWTFDSLRRESLILANHLASDLHIPVRTSDKAQDRMVIALLCPSTADFMLTVCACWQLGLGVLLLAPQNTPQAISYLCRVTQSTHLLYHSSMTALAQNASLDYESLKEIAPTLVQIPQRESWISRRELFSREQAKSCLSYEDEADTVAIIFHTSGSSGVPKPIYQNHRLWTEPLPCVPGEPAFTTTPLFHGGMSDFFRSINSKSALYFFPSSLPVTSSNLVQAVSARGILNKPTSFLSVPYIIQLLKETEDGLKLLQEFELVSTGGSPMPKEIGDSLVNQGVRLVSRYGSSECGFLMSSHRDYGIDKEWSYLRTNDAALKCLILEPHDHESFSLIVKSGWPSKCVSNQADGSYITGDIFIKHPTIEHAWLLSGRSDDVIVMVNGEKASPVPLEESLCTSPLIAEAVLFGANRSAIGALIVPSSEASAVTLTDLLPFLANTNRLAPSHSQISPELVLILLTDVKFPRASKGSLQRGMTYQLFEKEIERAYRSFESGEEESDNEDGKWKEGTDLLAFVKKVIEASCGVSNSQENGFGFDEDLFAAGVNSLQSTRIRNSLQKKLPLKGQKLSSNIVFECSTIRRSRLLGEETGDEGPSLDERELEYMQVLIDKLGAFETPSKDDSGCIRQGEHVILTGSTGSLGAHLLAQLLPLKSITLITLLLRAESIPHAFDRVKASLSARKLSFSIADWKKVRCLPADLSKSDLGVGHQTWSEMARETTLVLHAAWSVNFVGRLQGFVPHLEGLSNLIKTITQPTSQLNSRLYFCSSTASILNQDLAYPLLEEVSLNNEDAVHMGYARSKLVAERICLSASKTCLPDSRIGILRLGQLCADTQKGIWNETEGWPLLFASMEVDGKLPGLKENPAWLPVDKSAASILDIVLLDSSSEPLDKPLTYHIVATNLSTAFSSILGWFKKAGLSFDVVDPQEWVRGLKEAEEQGGRQDCLKLLDLWDKAYNHPSGGIDPTLFPNFDVSNAARYSQTIRKSEPISEELVLKMVDAWVQSGFLRKSASA